MNKTMPYYNTCSFIGHRQIENKEMLRDKVCNTVEKLITQKGVSTFLFGSKSAFDDLCLDVVTNLKDKYPHIKRIYVRSAFQAIGRGYLLYLLELYDDTYYPEYIENSGKASYVERNYEMVDKSAFCIFYYNENYIPTRLGKDNKYFPVHHVKSGTKVAYDYALKKKKEKINLYN